jgi:hypothetical protein
VAATEAAAAKADALAVAEASLALATVLREGRQPTAMLPRLELAPGAAADALRWAWALEAPAAGSAAGGAAVATASAVAGVVGAAASWWRDAHFGKGAADDNGAAPTLLSVRGFKVLAGLPPSDMVEGFFRAADGMALKDLALHLGWWGRPWQWAPEPPRLASPRAPRPGARKSQPAVDAPSGDSSEAETEEEA